jgi:predicted MFS family arabinose efflux permease
MSIPMNSFHHFSGLLLADAVGIVLLTIGVVLLVCGLVGAYFISRFAPKGTLLAVSVVIYIVSRMIDPGRSRELHLLVGTLSMLGTIGGILGIVDLLKKRKPRPAGDDQLPKA